MPFVSFKFKFKFMYDETNFKAKVTYETTGTYVDFRKRSLGSCISVWKIYKEKECISHGKTVDNTRCDEKVLISDKKDQELIDIACGELKKINVSIWEQCNWNTECTNETLENGLDGSESDEHVNDDS